MVESALETRQALESARKRLERAKRETMRWLTYDDDSKTGWVLWKNLLVKLRDTRKALRVQQALDLSQGIRPWLKSGQELLIAVPSQSGNDILLGIWNKQRGRTARNLMLLYPATQELVDLENTAGASWFDMSFDGRYVALVNDSTLALVDLDEMETRIMDTLRPNTLTFLPDGRLIARAVGRRTTVITPDTGEVRVEQPGTYVIPTAQPLNTQVHSLMHARDVEHRFRVVRKAPTIRLPQERYIPMKKEDKIRFNEWIASHAEE